MNLKRWTSRMKDVDKEKISELWEEIVRLRNSGAYPFRERF